MKKYILTIGLNDKDTKRPIFFGRQKITNLLKDNIFVKGYTIYLTKGGYKHNNGTFVKENSLRVELVDIEYNVVKNLIYFIKQLLNQESILLETININQSFM